MIAENGLPDELTPLSVGFLGYGNVSKGAQEMFDLLPFITIEPAQLKALAANGKNDVDNHSLYKVVFKEEDIVKPLQGEFSLDE